MKISRILILSAIPWLNSCDRSTDPEPVEPTSPADVGVLADAYESDDSLPAAKRITTDGVQQTRTLHGANAAPLLDVDWVAFDADTGFTYSVQQLSSNPDSVMIRCESGSWVAPTIDSQFQPSEGTYGKLVRFSPKKPGLCHAIVSGPQDSKYQISVLAAKGETLYRPDAWEPDDGRPTATILPLDGTWQEHTMDGLHLEGKPRTTTPDVDWFQFHADSGTTATILFEGNIRILRTVISPDGDTTTVLKNEVPILKSGTWTIVVRADGDMLGELFRCAGTVSCTVRQYEYITGLYRWAPYRIGLVGSPGLPTWTYEVHESDDSPRFDSAKAFAKAIESDSSASDRWLLESDQDWFTFEAQPGRSYSLHLELLDTLNRGPGYFFFTAPHIDLYDSTGKVIKSILTSPLFPVAFQDFHIAKTSGKVYFNVNQISQMGRYRYRLRLWSVADTTTCDTGCGTTPPNPDSITPKKGTNDTIHGFFDEIQPKYDVVFPAPEDGLMDTINISFSAKATYYTQFGILRMIGLWQWLAEPPVILDSTGKRQLLAYGDAFPCVTSGTYYLRLIAPGGTQFEIRNPTYQDPGEPVAKEVLPDSFENDDMRQAARGITPDSVFQNRTLDGLNIFSSDTDWVSFPVESQVEYRVHLLAKEWTDVKVKCFANNSQPPLAGFQPGTTAGANDIHKSFKASQSGTCYAEITGYRGIEYKLAISKKVPQVLQIQPDKFENDDSASVAKSITLDGYPQERTLHGTSISSTDIDWISFATDSGMLYEVHQGSSNQVRVEVRCGTDHQLVSTSDSLYRTPEGVFGGVRKFLATSSGTCHVVVRGNLGSPSYRITVKATIPDMPSNPDRWEPDNGKATATVLTPDGSWQNHTLDGLIVAGKPATTAPDVDWYQFHADSGTTATILFEGNIRILRTVISPDGDTATVLRNEIPILKSGTWTIVVRAQGDMLGDRRPCLMPMECMSIRYGYDNGLYRWVPYRIGLVQSPGLPSWTFEVHEADDTPSFDSANAFARAIEADSSATDRWLLDLDHDWFRFEAIAGQSYSLQLELLDTLNQGSMEYGYRAPHIYVYNSTGEMIKSLISFMPLELPGSFVDFLAAKTSGEVYLGLQQTEPMGRYRYRLRVWSVKTPEVAATSP